MTGNRGQERRVCHRWLHVSLLLSLVTSTNVISRSFILIVARWLTGWLAGWLGCRPLPGCLAAACFAS
jgi:hypothetical protein